MKNDLKFTCVKLLEERQEAYTATMNSYKELRQKLRVAKRIPELLAEGVLSQLEEQTLNQNLKVNNLVKEINALNIVKRLTDTPPINDTYSGGS